MAIKPVCDRCNNELAEFGAVLLSPPSKESEVKKLHLCVTCYQKIIDEMNSAIKN